MACAGCHRVVVYPLWPPHNGLRCRLLHLSGVWRLITVWCSQWAGLHLQDVVATISSDQAARISSSVPRQVHALVFRTDKVLHGRPLELGLLPVGRRYWHHHAWTHWDLNPGPSACEADVIPLHHVPLDAGTQMSLSDISKGKWRGALRRGSRPVLYAWEEDVMPLRQVASDSAARQEHLRCASSACLRAESISIFSLVCLS